MVGSGNGASACDGQGTPSESSGNFASLNVFLTVSYSMYVECV